MTDALEFFSKYVIKNFIKIVKTAEGFDLEYRGVEIGSYGYRECLFTKWIYATGLAEPRFSRMIYGN
jgi:hypothetical protein